MQKKYFIFCLQNAFVITTSRVKQLRSNCASTSSFAYITLKDIALVPILLNALFVICTNESVEIKYI